MAETNKLSKPVVSVDLRNIDKPIIRFRKAPPVEYIEKNTRRLQVEETIAESEAIKTKRLAAIKKGTVALIDLGSSKVMCLVVSLPT